ncbi:MULTISPECIES: YraN family protein [unclassified Luteococcus]|uniref:YraN family protein n=1 Tax=unclassified Luteococcus TaxID=2639923 RepID=UPI00313C08B5
MDERTPTHSRDQQLGRLGEDLADAHLRTLGWEIVGRNWRCSDGELDIIAREPLPRGRTALVFVEVKYRSGLGFGDPLEALTRAKVARLCGLAQLWLREQHDAGMEPWADEIRLDAVGVLRQPGGSHRITHARGITR